MLGNPSPNVTSSGDKAFKGEMIFWDGVPIQCLVPLEEEETADGLVYIE